MPAPRVCAAARLARKEKGRRPAAAGVVEKKRVCKPPTRSTVTQGTTTTRRTGTIASRMPTVAAAVLGTIR